MMTDLKALGHAMKRAQHRNQRAAELALREVGVTLVQWDALRAIDRMPRASGHDLAAVTFQSDQAFWTRAARLVGRGFITRTSGRGRRTQHALTDEGRVALRESNHITSQVLKDLFSPLEESEREALAALLASLLADEPESPHAVELKRDEDSGERSRFRP